MKNKLRKLAKLMKKYDQNPSWELKRQIKETREELMGTQIEKSTE